MAAGRLPRYAGHIAKGRTIEMILFCLVLYIVSHTRDRKAGLY